MQTHDKLIGCSSQTFGIKYFANARIINYEQVPRETFNRLQELKVGGTIRSTRQIFNNKQAQAFDPNIRFVYNWRHLVEEKEEKLEGQL